MVSQHKCIDFPISINYIALLVGYAVNQTEKLRVKLILFICISVSLLLISSCDPFNPDVEKDENLIVIGDNSTISGLMQNFVLSYSVKDSSLYTTLLDSDFVFSWDNNGVVESWNRDEDLRITKRLFRSFKKIDLVFNNDFPQANTPDTSFVASFNLGLMTGSGIENFTGHARFSCRRKNSGGKQEYKIYRWEDLK